MIRELTFEFPIFARWAFDKIRRYSLGCQHSSQHRNIPPRKGIPLGQPYPLSQVKYEAAVLSVLYGTKLKGFKLTDILGHIQSPPSLELFKKWRTEQRFKSLVESNKGEFAQYMGENIIYGGNELFPWLDDMFTTSEKLMGKIYFIREGLAYSPDLVSRISVALADSIKSQNGGQKIANFLGYYIWIIRLLDRVRQTGPKSRERSIYAAICKAIVGRHGDNKLLLSYLSSNASPCSGINPEMKWPMHFKEGRERGLAYIDQSKFKLLQDEYRKEFGAILNSEVMKLVSSTNTIDPHDIGTGINFLAGKYKFDRYQLYASEDFAVVFS